MKARSTLAACLTLVVVGVASPTVARADDPPPLVITRPLDVFEASSVVLPPRLYQLAPARPLAMGTEIRLSRGAKTAIIVTAIVVGVLIIAGVIAIGLPHHP